ncbi:MAG: restriction endonuclease subunit S [Synergistes sp.]|nr:restriction endonuclease subunit S [Synergistes sp.]
MELIELGSILKIEKGKKPVNQATEPKDGYLPYVDIDAFENGVIKKYTDGNRCTPCDNGDILIVCDGSRSGLVGKAIKGYIGSTLAKISAPGLSNDYLYYFVQGKYALLNTRKKGTGTPHLDPEMLKKQKLIVPDLIEQERIVAQIEEMFSQLDAGVETLKKTKAQLAVYRQAVLKEAFSSYREAKTVEIAEIVDDIRIGPFGTMLHRSDYISNGIPVINPQHIKGGKVISSPSVSISKEKATELSAYMLKTNDIIMGRRGEMGRSAAITDMENGWICGTGSILFRLKPEFDSVFYAQLLSSPDVVHYLEEHATGTTMKNLNEDIVQHIPVPFITAEFQKEITLNIESKMSVCDSLEQTVDATLQQAESMRQSILKQAFEGCI